MTTYINEDERLHQVREISTIKEMLTSGASLFGERPAFLVKKEKGGAYNPLTFRQVKEDVDALGTYMVNNGLKGEKIAIIGTNCYQWILAYFAVVCGGGIAVPLDKELTKEEIEILVKTADCKAVFYTDKYEKIFKEMPIPHQYKMNAYEDEKDKYEPQHIMNLVARGKILMEEGNRDYLDISIDPDVMAVILFTSGTTGVPKGVMLSNRNITSVLTGTSKIVQLREDEVALSVLPIHHTFESTMGIMVVFFQGGAIAFFEGLKYVLKNLQEAKASVLVGVPLIVES
ncbi:MAG: class I adenylate-forming enzyme family protein, partial [Anaerovoracaceae bacterium]